MDKANENPQVTPEPAIETPQAATDAAEAIKKVDSTAEGKALNIPKEDVKEAPKPAVEAPTDFDYSVYEREFLDSGDISKNSREELYKLFPKNLVDNYIENMKTAGEYIVSQSQKKAYEITGGEQGYADMVAWASKALSEDEIEAYNEVVSGGNERLALQAIKGLYARKAMESSNKPKITMGGAGGQPTDEDTFLSRQDYANAVADERYSKSPQYRAEIEAKLAKTLKLGGFKL